MAPLFISSTPHHQQPPPPSQEQQQSQEQQSRHFVGVGVAEAGEASMGISIPSRYRTSSTEFNSFRSDEIVAAPANLHILQEPMVGPEVTKMEMEKAGKKAVEEAMKKAAGKGGNKHEKRHQKISSSTSKKHLSRGKKTNSKKKASS
ncbi:hypothetical protein F5H01DRAFT_381954 [Linnemannia elongata]|nr:hypothetical protein F5H01DRAFT_381954 [Linnemannia elongata]